MTNDLKAKSQEFVDLGKNINKQLWNRIAGSHDYPPVFQQPNGEDVLLSEDDTHAIFFLPYLIEHIAELQKRLDDYEARINELKKMCEEAEEEKHCNQMSFYKWAYLDRHIKIMTGEDEG